MRIDRVTAHAFGHLREQSLELADGLTVVYGPNEAGKSTWHAALLAALCGRWPSRARDEPGIERRRPWTGAEWVVSAQLRLADGRRVELRHDLDARHGYAKDLDIVADHSAEITGRARGEVPDASRWLGLDRRAFVATACVRQSHLVLATEEASGVRGYVERAASTAPADETASAALARIDAFQREHVGTERSTTRPLQVAQRGRAEADEVLRVARAGQALREEQASAARGLRAAAQAALHRLRRREAAVAWAEAQRLRSRAGQARELADAVAAPIDVPGAAGVVGTSSVATMAVSAVEVAAAVEAWRTTLAVPTPTRTPAPGPAAQQVVTSGRRRSGPVLAAAALLVIAAVALFVAEIPVAGAALALVGAVTGALGFVQAGRESASRHGPAPTDLAAQQAVAEQQALAEQHAAEWEQRRDAAAGRVVAAAGELGLAADGAAEAVRRLEDWLATERDRQATRERSAAQAARLEALLDGATLAELEAAADRAQRRAAAAAAEASTVEAAETHDSDVDVEVLRREYQEADRRATLAEQALAALEREHGSVAEAEERLAAAEAQCQRLLALDDVLSRTRQFLARAQERVHRDIAPPLAEAVGRDVAAVTGGRYTEAIVDPGSLAVRLRGPGAALRDVEELSLGTVEQVYLLLRVALAERLVRPGESCPLLLDDVTVHADQDRTERILEVVLSVAQRHQVVLFSQQEQVRQWAAATLTDPRHALRELTTLAPA